MLRQPFKTCAHVVKLINFVQNRFKSHDCAPFIGAKKMKTSDGLLSSEDLKEEKVVTTSLTSIRLREISRAERRSEVSCEPPAHRCNG